MLQKKKKQIPRQKKYRLRTKISESKYIDLALISLTLVVVVLLSSTTIRLVRGESKSLPQEITILRTQIANGCGVAGAANRFSQWVDNYSDEMLKFDIIDVANFKNSAIPETMVLIRDPLALEKKAAIAGRLGIPEDNIILNELDDNFLALDVTIVIGKDFENYKTGPNLLQVQILNGCGMKNAARKFSVTLDDLSDEQFEFNICKDGNANDFNYMESNLLIQSPRAEKFAGQLAEKLKIKKNNIIRDYSENSSHKLDFTIIIGKDWCNQLSLN